MRAVKSIQLHKSTYWRLISAHFQRIGHV